MKTIKRNYDLIGSVISVSLCVIGWSLMLSLASCSKETLTEPLPADLKVKERVVKLQGWDSEKREGSCKILK